MHPGDEDYEAEAAELRAQDRHEHAYTARLMAHPDCNDPDHPGCVVCEPPDEPAEDPPETYYSLDLLKFEPTRGARCICTGMWFHPSGESFAFRGDLFRIGNTLIVNAVEQDEDFSEIDPEDRILECFGANYFERRRVFVMEASAVLINRNLLRYIRHEFTTTPHV